MNTGPSTWYLNNSPQEQLQAVLAALCTADWQIRNFDLDLMSNHPGPEDAKQQDEAFVQQLFDLVSQAVALVAEKVDLDPRVSADGLSGVLPVKAVLHRQDITQYDIDWYNHCLSQFVPEQ